VMRSQRIPHFLILGFTKQNDAVAPVSDAVSAYPELEGHFYAIISHMFFL
jgi:hypothetical protein